MGRHSDPDPRWFWLSLAAAAGKAVLAMLLVGALAVGVTTWLGGGGAEQGGEPVLGTPAGDLEPNVPAASTEAEPVDEPDEEASEAEEPSEEDQAIASEPATEADGGDDAPVRATVQVLNGSGDASALQEVIAALEELGYQVVADARASRSYTRTTVFWSEGFDDEARALRRSDERFGVLQANDRLDPTINLHVVVGRDWVTARAEEPSGRG